MMRAALLLPVALAGCAVRSEPVATDPDPAPYRRVIAMAADQVRLCYRAPRLNRNARQIVTVIRVRYGVDGMLLAQPEVVRQSGLTEANLPYAGQMARAAIEAVIRCSPIKLPTELHQGGWDDFELTFSPRGLA